MSLFTARRKQGPLSEESVPTNRGCGVLLFLLFFLGGTVLFVFTVILPTYRMVKAKSWMPVQATVVDSKVSKHSLDNSTKYSVKIRYRYRLNNQTFESDRYRFLKVSSSDRSRHQAIVDEFPAGRRFTCYVNPENPEQAVIVRELGNDVFFGLFALPFILIGLWGMYFTARGGRKKQFSGPREVLPVGSKDFAFSSGSASNFRQDSGRESWLPKATYLLKPSSTGEFLLSSPYSAKRVFLFMLVLCLIWNAGIAYIFYDFFTASKSGGDLEQSPLILLLVGVGLFVASVYFGLALRIPKLKVYLAKEFVEIGQEVALRWELVGKSEVVSELVFTLKGLERASYKQDDSTYADENAFYEQEIFRVAGVGLSQGGTIRCMIPKGSMHSFSASNNKVIWSVEARGEIAAWPNMKESFLLNVLPERVKEDSHV